MVMATPFNVDAATASEHELARLPPHGGSSITAFCGVDDAATAWDERGVCVLRARKGFGKSHLLKVRSLNHRSSTTSTRTLFYPVASGRSRTLVDALSSLHVVVPRWLQGKDAGTPWLHVWQLSILGLLVWLTEARTPSPRGYSEWFGELEALDQVHRDHRNAAPDGDHPNVMLTMFMARILEHLPADDFTAGSNQLKQALSYAASDWAVALTSRLKQSGKQRIAMYLDAPDELVELDPPSLWRNVQQGLVLAIWKFSKSSTLSHLLNIYATVRSEAFGSAQDHPDLALAMGLVMPLQYDAQALKAIVCDRIRQADPTRLSLPLVEGVDPVHALCGFGEVVHEDRDQERGGRYTEDIFRSMLRHTRLVPREVIAIAGAVYAMSGTRSFDTVSRTVNAQASQNINWAIRHSFLGWSDSLHRRFAAALKQEVIDGKTIAALAAQFNEDGPRIIKFFVQHGLLGTAERVPKRHRHYYRQRFAFDEVHGHDDAVAVNKDFFFLHPAFKEWIRSQPEQMETQFERLKVGAVGDLEPYESQPPLLRLCVKDEKAFILFRTRRRMSILEKGAESDPLRFLFVLLWAHKHLKAPRVDIFELKKVWATLRSMDRFKDILRLDLPHQFDDLTEKIRDWQKKINADPDIKDLQRMFARPTAVTSKDRAIKTAPGKRAAPFLSVSNKSKIGAQIEIWFPNLSLDDFDADDSMLAAAGARTK